MQNGVRVIRNDMYNRSGESIGSQGSSPAYQGWGGMDRPSTKAEDPQQGKLNDILSKIRCRRLSSVDLVSIDRSLPPPRGGFGEVRPGILGGRAEPVAVKELKQDGNLQKRLRTEIAFARELTVWADLVHPNVLDLVAFYMDVEEGSMWFISPFATQGNVTTYLKVNNADMPMRLQLSLDTAEGLAYLHKRKICHGDLKGANVVIFVVDGKPKAKLCDFGLTKIAESAPAGLETSTFERKGTVRYLSPELLCDEPKRGTSSDVWAWGCLVLEITTDKIPYDTAKERYGVIVRILGKASPAVISRLPVSHGVRDLLRECWSHEPSERPTIEKCCGELSRIINP